MDANRGPAFNGIKFKTIFTPVFTPLWIPLSLLPACKCINFVRVGARLFGISIKRKHENKHTIMCV